MSVSEAQQKAGEKWIADFYHLMETFDLRKWTSTCLESDVAFNFTNMQPLKGHEGVHSVFVQMAGGVSRMTHQLNDGIRLPPGCSHAVSLTTPYIVKVLPDRILVASTVNYRFVNGERTSMKVFSIVHKGPEDERAKGYDIYGDFAPMWQIVAELQVKVQRRRVPSNGFRATLRRGDGVY
ncbi:hypothetical protein BDZ89DRAFT_1045614 [Hymenopellis radicata]|nr:hypothetical protein BDZ89DRAFT_1045614 [Hymenopellis radicata]